MAADEPEDIQQELDVDLDAHEETTEPTKRGMRTTDRILEKYGFTPHCPGCESKLGGPSTNRGHSAECRQRIYDEMAKEEHGREKLEAVKKRLVRPDKDGEVKNKPNQTQRKRPRVKARTVEPEAGPPGSLGGWKPKLNC